MPKIIDNISQRFAISHENLYLMDLSYFSKITNKTSDYSEKILHEPHVDVDLHKSAHYTVIIYLTTFEKDFSGGKLVFTDSDEKGKKSLLLVEPKAGRVLGYTSGWENLSYLDKVLIGEDIFLTMFFTCDKEVVVVEK